ncbi:PLP-dependent transferase [Erwinia sp. V90_4]|uniref:PLP-dependent transferase n=1 Tax=Erwinia sp. V90_4 TaxID=3044239 RepID=UPI00165407FC|nr:PLP-dependent transferase [Erwinia sp. V90_4]MDI3441503.1 PLP-dependent transferase [Erwinia sp. V90_4]
MIKSIATMDTASVHAGRHPAEQHGFVNPAIHRGSTVLAPTVDDLLNYRQPFIYGRMGNPTTAALKETLRVLDHSAEVLLFPSGLAAIATALLSSLDPGA